LRKNRRKKKNSHGAPTHRSGCTQVVAWCTVHVGGTQLLQHLFNMSLSQEKAWELVYSNHLRTKTTCKWKKKGDFNSYNTYYSLAAGFVLKIRSNGFKIERERLAQCCVA
jgi:hypothetical protein